VQVIVFNPFSLKDSGMPWPRSRLTTLLFITCCGFSQQILANFELIGSAALVHDNNVSNATSEADIFSDYYLDAQLNFGKLWTPAVGRSLLLSGHFSTKQYEESTGLNQVALGISLDYTHRLGLGAYAPRIGLNLRMDDRDFQTDMRDGRLYKATVSLEKRFLPEFHAMVAVSRERRTADENKAMPYYIFAGGDVFNQDNTEALISADYTLPGNSTITARYLWRKGEVDASTRPGSSFFLYSDEISFDYEICRACGQYVAYRIDAHIHDFLLEWNWELQRDTSLGLSLERKVAHAAGNNTYTGNITRLQLNHRF
jgi:hypothetical protein